MKRKIASVVPGFPTALSVALVSDLVAMVPALYLLNQPMTERVHVFELPFKPGALRCHRCGTAHGKGPGASLAQGKGAGGVPRCPLTAQVTFSARRE